MIKRLLYIILVVIILLVLLISTICLWPASNRQSPKPFDNVVVFGDSLSDSQPMNSSDGTTKGNNYWVQPGGIPKPIGAPITSQLSEDASQRYTWLNYLVQQYPFATGKHDLAIKRDLGSIDPYSHNVSYAVASAETGNNYIDDMAIAPWPVVSDRQCTGGIGDYGKYSCVPGILKQVHMYLEDVNNQPNQNTLFILWGGGNDFYQNVVKLLKSSPLDYSHPIANTTKAVKMLMSKGVPGEHIYVLNLPNFSMVPAITTLVDDNLKSSYQRWGALTGISIMSNIYNIWLKSQLVIATWGDFSPSNVISIDNVFLDVYENQDDLHQKLNITHPVDVTCAAAEALPVCQGFLFYNDMHPVTDIHAYLAGLLSRRLGADNVN